MASRFVSTVERLTAPVSKCKWYTRYAFFDLDFKKAYCPSRKDEVNLVHEVKIFRWNDEWKRCMVLFKNSFAKLAVILSLKKTV